MSSRYTATAVTGMNDPAKTLRCVDDQQLTWDSFADAKAAAVVRAEVVREYLESADCRYRMQSESGDHHFEIRFEYGPASLEPDFPFRTVFHVREVAAHHGPSHEVGQ